MIILISSLLLSFLSLSFASSPSRRQQLYVGDLSGCNNHNLLPLPLPLTSHLRLITSSGRLRSYTAHLPALYNPSNPTPLIVGYHGSSSIGLFFSADTLLSLPTFTPNTIMLYPDGINGSWAGPSYASTTVAEDLQFTADMLADVRRTFCVDSARIYATGISNGGGFVGTLACAGDGVGKEFAAFAPSSGSFYTDAGPGRGSDQCRPAREVVPVLEFHGGADQSVRYGGGQGEGGIEPSIPDWLGFWAERNGCESPPEIDDSFDGDVHHYVWTCRGQYGALQHWKVDDMKHDWPSTIPNFSQLAAGDKPTRIEASALIQTFFANFTRPAE